MEDEWIIEDPSESAPPAEEAAAEGEAPAAEEGAGDVDELEELEDEAPRKARISDRPILFKYWKR